MQKNDTQMGGFAVVLKAPSNWKKNNKNIKKYIWWICFNDIDISTNIDHKWNHNHNSQRTNLSYNFAIFWLR